MPFHQFHQFGLVCVWAKRVAEEKVSPAGAKPIMWVELPVFILLLVFLALEIYAEQRQLVFQAILFQVSLAPLLSREPSSV